uniref:Apoptosis-stimulating of p53 protein 1 n=2 Tax=Culex pipiens TaxID=7175 RepID=A0A8D8GY75_CULPI
MLNKKSHMRSSELRTMALRQKHQIDKQQQLLAAREQRLRFLKTQEANETAVTAEGERLRRLRERVEAQESKLRRLRALRGQVDLQKTYNVSLVPQQVITTARCTITFATRCSPEKTS